MSHDPSFFAGRLLRQLETEPPLRIAFASQAESAIVGFDFKTARLAFVRLADEMRELSEAAQLFETGGDTLAHLCDEATDVIFGTINVLRHASLAPADIFQTLNGTPSERAEMPLESSLEEVRCAFHAFQEAFVLYETTPSATEPLLVSGIALMQAGVDFVGARGVHPNDVMRANVKKYLIRCLFIEESLEREEKTWRDVSLEEIYARWKASKQAGL